MGASTIGRTRLDRISSCALWMVVDSKFAMARRALSPIRHLPDFSVRSCKTTCSTRRGWKVLPATKLPGFLGPQSPEPRHRWAARRLRKHRIGPGRSDVRAVNAPAARDEGLGRSGDAARHSLCSRWAVWRVRACSFPRRCRRRCRRHQRPEAKVAARARSWRRVERSWASVWHAALCNPRACVVRTSVWAE